MTDDMTPSQQRNTRILVTVCCSVLSAVAGLLVGLAAAQPQPSNNPLHDIDEMPAILGFADVGAAMDFGEGRTERGVSVGLVGALGEGEEVGSGGFIIARDGSWLTQGSSLTLSGYTIGAAHLVDDDGDAFLVVRLPDVPEPRVLIGIME